MLIAVLIGIPTGTHLALDKETTMYLDTLPTKREA